MNRTFLFDFYNLLISDMLLMKARMAADRERQLLIKENEALQKVCKELEAEKRSLLEDQVCYCINCMLVV